MKVSKFKIGTLDNSALNQYKMDNSPIANLSSIFTLLVASF